MDQPKIISAAFIHQHHDYPRLIEQLKVAFATSKLTIPDRLHYDFGASKDRKGSTLLLMPAWQDGKDIGIKLVTINPQNRKLRLPSIQGSYIFMDATTGITKAIIDAKPLTLKRTAATSALAASFLAPPRASSLLMVGTGALAPELIAAHAAIRPIKRVFIWGRNFTHAQQLAASLEHRKYSVKAIKKIKEKVNDVDVISTATLSPDPLVLGADLRPGQHIDLVGSYKPTMRESDDEVVRRAKLFVDTYAGALKESGDLFLPLQQGVISRADIRAELRELCSGEKSGRNAETEITFFKSVGNALEDLVAARFFFQLHQKHEGL